MNVLYSFPHRLGGPRIGTTAWHQVTGAEKCGTHVSIHCGSIDSKVTRTDRMRQTLACGKCRVPMRFVRRDIACDWHDRVTAKWLEANHSQIDVVHGWPLASIRTFRMAHRHGIPCMIERPNAHTAFAYQAVAEENQRVGIQLSRRHDHSFNRKYLNHEELEYNEADFLLCPSEFVAETFAERGYPPHKLVRHQYGFDPSRFRPGQQNPTEDRGLIMLYAGVVEPRKGLHFALQAWFKSGAQVRGKFLICGSWVEGYRERLGSFIEHPSIEILGHRNDLHLLMPIADLFVLSSIEEGSALVTYEARGAGCVLLVSSASGAPCEDGINGLMHPPRDAALLASQIAKLDADRAFLRKLRETSISTLHAITWEAAGVKLAEVYGGAVEGFARPVGQACANPEANYSML